MTEFKPGDTVWVQGEISKAGELTFRDTDSGVIDYLTRYGLSRAITAKTPPTEKVVVPKFVADKIAYCKEASGYGLFHAMDHCFQYKESADWLEDNQDLFARAWLDGYEIEEEQLYTVEIPAENGGVRRLYKNGTMVVLSDMKSKDWPISDLQKLTKKEIKQDFEWAWQWAEEVMND